MTTKWQFRNTNIDLLLGIGVVLVGGALAISALYVADTSLVFGVPLGLVLCNAGFALAPMGALMVLLAALK